MTDRTEARKAELREIEKQGGGVLHPAAVVEFARDKKTALHSAFDWNDTSAAAQWRLQQARNLIRVMVQIVEDPRGNEPLTVRMYTALAEDRAGDGENGYRYTPQLMTTATGRAAVLATALAELEAFQEKFAALTELADVFAAIRKARK